MAQRHGGSSPGRMRRLIGVVLLGIMAVAVTPRAASAQVAAPPDIAAMALTPADLAGVGLPSYGLSNGILTAKPQAVAEFASYWRSDPDVEVIRSAMAAAAPASAYALHLIRPTTEGDASVIEERVVAYVMSFADEASATAGYAAWAHTWQAGYPAATPTVAVGDERFVVAGEAHEGDGSAFPFVHVGFRTGSVVAAVSAEFFTGFAPDQATVEALAVRQQERIGSTVAGGSPDLSGRILQFDVPGVQALQAAYVIRDGQRSFRDTDTASSAAEDQANVAAAGIVDQFSFEQQLAGDPAGTAPPLAFFSARIVTFASVEAASAYVVDSVNRLTEGGAANLAPVGVTAAAGEQVAAYTYTHQNFAGVQLNDYRIYARTGSTVFSFAINTTGQIDLAAMDAVAALQASCIAGTASCAVAYAVPATLLP